MMTEAQDRVEMMNFRHRLKAKREAEKAQPQQPAQEYQMHRLTPFIIAVATNYMEEKYKAIDLRHAVINELLTKNRELLARHNIDLSASRLPGRLMAPIRRRFTTMILTSGYWWDKARGAAIMVETSRPTETGN